MTYSSGVCDRAIGITKRNPYCIDIRRSLDVFFQRTHDTRIAKLILIRIRHALRKTNVAAYMDFFTLYETHESGHNNF